MFVTDQTPAVPTIENEPDVLKMTSAIVAAYVGKNSVPTAQIAEVISSVHAALKAVGQHPPGQSEPMALKPAVSIRKSVQPEYLVCLEDGRRLKLLKRHLRTVYGLTPEQYRAKWGLPHDYPMVAPNYAEQRSRFAKTIGLGKVTPISKGQNAAKKARA